MSSRRSWASTPWSRCTKRQRYRAAKPISTSRVEGTVNHLVNARMNKREQMRWSPLGAHRVLQVRAALLDARFGLGPRQHAPLFAA